ncbi:Recombination protein RecR [Candidatus Rubidus massiliensis]|nr:Recombination protein RecR [Candidatus Rubidus massiliensis]
MKYPLHLLKVMELLKKLPGVGSKSAERFAFQLLNWSTQDLQNFASLIQEIPVKLSTCHECGCLEENEKCLFCTNDRIATKKLCIIASAKDAFAIESTGEYDGLYHILGGLLSPMDGIHSEKLQIEKLKFRIQTLQIKEIVIALDSTLEGDTTSLYLKKELSPFVQSISRLAFGIPIGSSLDYVDGGTLARAFAGRSLF